MNHDSKLHKVRLLSLASSVLGHFCCILIKDCTVSKKNKKTFHPRYQLYKRHTFDLQWSILHSSLGQLTIGKSGPAIPLLHK